MAHLVAFHDIRKAKVLYRIDLATSGLIIFGCTPAATKKFHLLMKDRKIKKEYLAWVYGKFPEGEVICDAALAFTKQPNIHGVCETGKPSTTIFKRKSYHKETHTSIVICKPLTGRTHQIRVHLQHLGHAIVHDPIYKPKETHHPQFPEYDAYAILDSASCTKKRSISDISKQSTYSLVEMIDKDQLDPFCLECNGKDPRIDVYGDGKHRANWVGLHCFQYEFDDQIFNSSHLPRWATM